jgi:ribosomal protein S18 acetylase RimI-like enzyme
MASQQEREDLIVKLREPTEDDYATLLSWVEGDDEESFREWSGPKITFPPRSEGFQEELEVNVKHPFFMARESGGVIGFGQLMLRGEGRVHLIRLIISPAHRGLGYGKQLCSLLIKEGMKRWGKRRFSLNVNRSNSVAKRLYEQLGFKPAIAPKDSVLGGDIVYMLLACDGPCGQ